MYGQGEVTALNWRPVHTKILILMERGVDRKEIIKETDVSERTFNRIVGSPFFKERLTQYTAKVSTRTLDHVAENQAQKDAIDKARETLVMAAPTAARVVRRFLTRGGSKDRIRFEAAKDILDRAGIKPREVTEITSRVYTPQEIESSLHTALELESVMSRLSNQPCQFVLEKPDGKESSVTDNGSTSQPESSPPEPQEEVAADVQPPNPAS